MQRVIDIVLCIRLKVKFSNFMEKFQPVISFMDTTYLKSSQLTNIKILRGVDSACAEMWEYHFISPNLFLQHFYAQLATQGSSWLELSTIWLYLPPGLIRSWLAIRITLANTKDITAIKGLHFIYLYFSVRSLHWELKHLASTCTKRSAEQLVSMHWYKNRFGFSSADTLR